MEATHFIEVYSGDTTRVMPIKDLTSTLEDTLRYEFLETVAVWRIKETDVPIEKRLGDRFLGGAGLVSPNYLDRAVKLSESMKRDFSTANSVHLSSH
jgi:hypothetical protein